MHAAGRTLSPEVEAFFDSRTCSAQYVVACPHTGRCAIVDPVLDFDEKSGATATRPADEILAYIATLGLRLAASAERRCGKKCVSTCRFRWSSYDYTKIKYTY